MLFSRTFFVSWFISKMQSTILWAAWLRLTYLFFKVLELKIEIFLTTSSVFSSSFMKFPSLFMGHKAQNLFLNISINSSNLLFITHPSQYSIQLKPRNRNIFFAKSSINADLQFWKCSSNCFQCSHSKWDMSYLLWKFQNSRKVYWMRWWISRLHCTSIRFLITI